MNELGIVNLILASVVRRTISRLGYAFVHPVRSSRSVYK